MGNGGSGGGAAGASGGSSDGGAGGRASSEADATVEAGAAGGSDPKRDPNGYLRAGNWHGFTTTQASTGATIERQSFVKLPVCASGSVPRDSAGFATLGVNLNQDPAPAGAPADSVVPTKAGLVVHVSNVAASPLRLEIAGADPGDEWCLDLYGGGGFYPWTSFKSRCWTTGGSAYDGKQGLTRLSISVPGNAAQPVPFDFCLDDFNEANSGDVGSCSASDPLCSPALIDDFEGQAGMIYAQDGRSGSWYPYNDESADAGAQEVLFQRSPGHLSEHALECKGAGFTVWGTGLGAQLNAPPGAKLHPYDASRYAGLHFWYMSSTKLRFLVRTIATSSKDDIYIEGGACTFSVSDCSSFQIELAPASSWTEMSLPWSSLIQPSWSVIPNTVLDPKSLIEVRFETFVNDTFDYVIDDLSFL